MAKSRRRLAAILSADVVGYSRLMGSDEEATIAALDARRQIFRDRITGRSGRVVDTAGDSVLAVFDSVVEAVRCATEVQDGLVEANAALPEDRRMRFRIGVNLGDVVEKDDGTIYGDGVNIAARLESLAEPDGIAVSGDAYRQVEDKVKLSFRDLGEHEVKNIVRPLQVYTVQSAGASPAIEIEERGKLSSKPSIAVLPLDNLSGDPEQEYFADGITEDLITELSRLRWLLVTARNSTFTYKGQAVDLMQVGRELGVRYVVEGSVRKGGERVRITAQLIDAATAKHIWAERYDRDLSDIFALQDEITETLVAALQGEVGEFERDRARRKPPDSLDAWESYQRGMWHVWKMTAKDLVEAHRLLSRAGESDPNFAQAFAALGYTLFLQVFLSYVDSPLEALEQALRFANKAVAIDNREAMAHFTLGRVQTLRGEYKSAIAELRASIDLNPSSAHAHLGLGVALMLSEQLDEAINEYDTAIRLSPRDPAVWSFYGYRAQTCLLMRDYAAAVDDAHRAIRHPSATFWPHAYLASALGLLDRTEEARTAVDKLLALEPDFTPRSAMAAYSPLNPEALKPLFETWIDGLRKAGLDIPDGTAEAN